MNSIQVVDNEDGKFFLRIYLHSPQTGAICFCTNPEFTKSEADFRAVLLSSDCGFRRDQLPNHNKIEAYPKEGPYDG